MVIKSSKKNPMVKDLFSKKYKPKIVKPKKGKGSFKNSIFIFSINLKILVGEFSKTKWLPISVYFEFVIIK